MTEFLASQLLFIIPGACLLVLIVLMIADDTPELSPARADGEHLGSLLAELRRNNEQLREAEQEATYQASLLQALLDNSPDPVYFKDRDHRFLAVSKSKVHHRGTTQEDIVGKTDFDFLPEAEAKATHADEQQVIETGQPLVNRTEQITQADGSTRWYSVSKAPYYDENGEVAGIVGISRDITERKQAEEALRQSEGKLQAMLESLHDHMGMMDKDLNIVWANKVARQIFGDDIIGKKCYEVYRGRDKPCEPSPCITLKAFADGRVHKHETVVQAPDGTTLDYACTASVALRDDQGNPTAVIEVSRDITERKRNERRLAEMLKHLQAVNDSARALASTLDPDSVLRIVLEEVGRIVPGDRISVVSREPGNHRLRVITVGGEGETDPLVGEGTEIDGKDTLIGQVIAEKTSQYIPDLGQIQTPVEQHLYQMGIRSVVSVPIISEYLCVGSLNVGRKEVDAFSEQERELLESLTPYVAAAIKNARTYSQLRKARAELEATQQEMVRVERMRTVGEVAGGVAHDFNNVLGTILGQSQLLLAQSKDEAMRESLELMQTAARLGRETVKRVQRFVGKQGEEAYVVVNLNELIEGALEMMRYRWKDEAEREGLTITIEKHLEVGSLVRANSAELREVLINLITNACDALPEGGAIRVATAETEGWATVEIADNGVGMDEETCAQVFDLFFTTKGAENSGLGLAISQGSIQRHGGRIELDSTLGEGTVVRVRLPVARSAAEEPHQEYTEPVTAGPLRVLIVDDDHMLLGTMQEALKLLEYDADAAPDGPAALQRVEAEHFDVVITDLGMPGMSGWQVAEQVKRLSPQTYVIILTGWGDTIQPGQYVDETLTKPVEMDTLRQVLGQLSNRHAA